MVGVCRFLALAIVAVFMLARGQIAALAEDAGPGAWETTLDRPAVEIGGHVSEDGGSAEINILAPLIFSEGRDLLFFGADAKVFLFDANDLGDTVYNAGAYLGYRSVLDDNYGVFGVWAGLDHLRTEDANDFTRAIAGVEYFGAHVIARANAFVPLDSTSDEWEVVAGGFINTYDEKIPSGFDAELGLRVAVPMESLARPGEFRVFAGSYDYIGLDDDGGDVLGLRTRVELDLYPFQDARDTRLSLEAGYAYDKHSGDQFSAGMKLSIPLGVRNKVATSHGKDPDVVSLDSFGQDLFQPVRRNREMVSRIRLKDRRPDTGSITGNYTLTTICGGSSGSLKLNGGLASSSIKQGDLLGAIDPNGANTPLALNLATMVAPDGRTLAEILAPKPDVVRTTLKFATSTVNFGTQTVAPAAKVALASQPLNGQSITDATVTIDGRSCSLNLVVQPALTQGLTLASICGGTSSNISLSPGLASASIKQGAVIGTIDPSGIATALKLDIGSMVAPSGQTLAQMLSAKPVSLKSTFKFAVSKVDFVAQSVRPSASVALATGNAAQQFITNATLTVNSLSCSLDLDIVETVPQGLTLASVCGGSNAAISLNGGLSTSSIKQGAALGIIDPTGAASALSLDIAGMVAPGGQTLAQLLASKPATLSSTFTFAQNTVNFATQTVQPSAAVALATGGPANQIVTAVTLTVNSKSCSLNVAVEEKPVPGLTLASVCGGTNAAISLNGGLATSSIKQGAALGIIDPAGAASSLSLDIADMVAPGGQTLAQLLASKPATLSSTFTFAQSTVNFATQTVQPAAAVALATGNAKDQLLKGVTLTVNSTSCSLDAEVETKPVSGLTLATICGGVNADLPLSNVHGVPMLSNTIRQGDLVGTIEPDGAATPLTLDLANMVDDDGVSLTQLLAGKPQSLKTTLYFPLSTVDFIASVVRPSVPTANTLLPVEGQRIRLFRVEVNGTSCSAVTKPIRHSV